MKWIRPWRPLAAISVFALGVNCGGADKTARAQPGAPASQHQFAARAFEASRAFVSGPLSPEQLANLVASASRQGRVDAAAELEFGRATQLASNWIGRVWGTDCWTAAEYVVGPNSAVGGYAQSITGEAGDVRWVSWAGNGAEVWRRAEGKPNPRRDATARAFEDSWRLALDPVAGFVKLMASRAGTDLPQPPEQIDVPEPAKSALASSYAATITFVGSSKPVKATLICGESRDHPGLEVWAASWGRDGGELSTVVVGYSAPMSWPLELLGDPSRLETLYASPREFGYPAKIQSGTDVSGGPVQIPEAVGKH